jgi:outer membrane protein assembly factor BamD (BamD/ComL family)
MAIVLPACASVSAMLGTGEAYTHMRRAEPLMTQHDFEGALREYQEAAALSPAGPPGDEALFAMALIHAHYGNPKKDYRKSLALFSRLAKEYPGSPRAEEAKIWVGVLEAIEKTKQVDAEIEERKKGLVK